MQFWDRFILAIYFGLAQHLPVGRDIALGIFNRAIVRNRLKMTDLNETSLFLLLALLPSDSPHRNAVLTLARLTGLHVNPNQLVPLLQRAAPPRLTEVVELGRPPGLHLGVTAFLQAFLAPNQLHVLENLCLYLSRLQLDDPNSPQVRALAYELFSRANTRYLQLPLGEFDYLAYFYRVVRFETQSLAEPLQGVFSPGPRPAWFLALRNAEQEFINACQYYLDEPAADVLHLHLYARLDVEQLAAALLNTHPQTVDRIAERIEQGWNAIL